MTSNNRKVSTCLLFILLSQCCLGFPDLTTLLPDKGNVSTPIDDSNQIVSTRRPSRNRVCLYNEWRLPRSVLPQHYDIEMEATIGDKHPGFRGHVIIHATCVTTTRLIVLHTYKTINIEDFEIRRYEEEESTSSPLGDSTNSSWTFCNSQEQMQISLNHLCESGERVIIQIRFSSRFEDITKQGNGFYTSRYWSDQQSQYLNLANTKMETHYARRVFPCFDEPDMKSTFQLKMIRSKEYFSLFNAPLLSTHSTNNDKEIDVFAKSELMSTYLVAFALLPKDYDFAESNLLSTKIRFYGPKYQMASLQASVDYAKRCLEVFNNLFNYTVYNLSKMDNLIVPLMQSLAMENWGLIIYKNVYISSNNSFYDLNKVGAKVIAHEIAHQWAGNLVTMKWWNDLWLNEGLATYLMLLAPPLGTLETPVDHIFFSQIGAWKHDSMLSVPVIVSSQIKLPQRNDFSIIYHKAASVFKMIESVVGKKEFLSTLALYFHRFAYKSVDTEMFLSSLTDIYNNHVKVSSMPYMDFEKVFDPWMKQMNSPIIKMTLSEDNRTVIFQQKRFLLDEDAPKLWPQLEQIGAYRYLWNVPITYFTSENSKISNIFWLNSSKDMLVLPTAVEWIKINGDHESYYISKYDSRTWRSLIAAADVLSSFDVTGLIYDAYQCLISNEGDIDMLFTILPLALKSTSHSPLTLVDVIVERLVLHLRKLPLTLQKFQTFLRNILNGVEVVWNVSLHNDEEILRRKHLLSISIMGEEESSLRYCFEAVLERTSANPHQVPKEVLGNATVDAELQEKIIYGALRWIMMNPNHQVLEDNPHLQWSMLMEKCFQNTKYGEWLRSALCQVIRDRSIIKTFMDMNHRLSQRGPKCDLSSLEEEPKTKKGKKSYECEKKLPNESDEDRVSRLRENLKKAVDEKIKERVIRQLQKYFGRTTFDN